MHTVAAKDPRVAGLPSVALRFLRYVQVDTQSDPDSPSIPSTEKQKDLGRLLLEELRELDVESEMDDYGYVFATIPAVASTAPALALLAHVDTSPDEPGRAHPLVHFDYDGEVIELAGGVRLKPDADLLACRGHHIITSDGTTLLGSDDKAGVAVLMQLAEDLLADESPRPEIRLCFTVDEEIGRGVDHLSLDRLGARVAYTIDGGGTESIYAETFNAAEALVEIKGVMVHPGYAKGIMVNALRIAGELIALLPASEAPETTDGREGYIHPHGISESDPSFARVKIILRDFTGEGLSRRKQYVEDAVNLLRAKYPKAEIALRLTDQYRNMRSYIDDVDPRALTFAHAAAAELGIRLEEELVRGGTDGARLSELGIPTPNIFNGGHNFHSRFEWNTVQYLELSLAYVKRLVRYWGENG